MDNYDRMIHSAEFDGISVTEQYFWLARAYLDGSRVLCESLIEEDYSPQYSSTRVILHLCRHAVELFLKGAIATSTNAAPPQTHNLDQLLKEYQQRFPDPVYWFDVPFGFENLGTQELFPELLTRYHKTLDQRYRYPAASDGQPFNSLEGFIPGMFHRELTNLWKVLLALEFRIKETLGTSGEGQTLPTQ